MLNTQCYIPLEHFHAIIYKIPSFLVTQNMHKHNNLGLVEIEAIIGLSPPAVSLYAGKRKSGLGVSCESVPVSLSMVPQQWSRMFNAWSLFLVKNIE